MQPNDFTFEATKQFVEDTRDLEEFDPYSYTKVDEEQAKKLSKDEVSESMTLPITITNFPWNPKFEGIVFSLGKVSIEENSDDTASLDYSYTVHENPKDLSISTEENTSSLNTEDDELLAVFVGRMVESLLFKMSQDENFLEQMRAETAEDKETKGSE